MVSLSLIRAIEEFFSKTLEAKKLHNTANFGRPRLDNMRIFRGIIRLLLKGERWKNFDPRYGSRATAHRRFLEWAENGIFRDIWQFAVEFLRNEGFESDFKFQVVDGSDRPVKNMRKTETSIGFKHRGKQALKVTILVTASGIPLGLDLSGSADHDSTRLKDVLESCVLKPEKSVPETLLGDAGYIGKPAKKAAEKYNYKLITPAKSNSIKQNTKKEEKLLKKRGSVERVFARLFQFSRLDRIFDKTRKAYGAWCELALSLITLTHFYRRYDF